MPRGAKEALPRPAWVQTASQHSAIELFSWGARSVRRDYEPTAGDVVDIASVCRLVDGMPLAILLAAAWMDVVAAAQERGGR